MVTDEKLLTVEEWMAQHFSTPPTLTTVWKWIRNGYISPQPVKCGRSWYLQPNAQYTEPQVKKLVERVKTPSSITAQTQWTGGR